MINEFIDFVEELFPSISPYTKENVKKAIKQFYETKSIPTYSFFTTQPLNYLAQGDIIEKIPFVKYNKDGKEERAFFKAIIISNTCDCDNDSNILLAPLLELNSIDLNINSIQKNTIYNLLYFPDSFLKNFVIDLSIINSFPTQIIINAIKEKKFKKISSLNRFGYYLLICKLTVHLLRPEDIEVNTIHRKV